MEFSTYEKIAIKWHFLESPASSLDWFYHTQGSSRGLAVPCECEVSGKPAPLFPCSVIHSPLLRIGGRPREGLFYPLPPQVTLPHASNTVKLLKPPSNSLVFPVSSFSRVFAQDPLCGSLFHQSPIDWPFLAERNAAGSEKSIELTRLFK